MNRIPFGIRQLDTIIDGGAPPGSVVLLSGEAGAGSREFLYTSTAINGLAKSNDDLHDLYYGQLEPNAYLPEEIHYLSFTADESQLRQEIGYTLDEEIVDAGLEAVEFHDLSEAYFHQSRVPREWYADETPHIQDMRGRHERDGILSRLAGKLTQHAPNNLVIIDSVSDLLSATNEDLSWEDVTYLMRGIQKAAYSWDGLVLAEINREALTPERHGQLVDAVTGTMVFNWESGGSERARTLVFKQFRGVLSQLEEENIIQFETEVSADGFDISDVRKIR
jgi:archaellum biogenesis ATPase FlaH